MTIINGEIHNVEIVTTVDKMKHQTNVSKQIKRNQQIIVIEAVLFCS